MPYQYDNDTYSALKKRIRSLETEVLTLKRERRGLYQMLKQNAALENKMGKDYDELLVAYEDCAKRLNNLRGAYKAGH